MSSVEKAAPKFLRPERETSVQYSKRRYRQQGGIGDWCRCCVAQPGDSRLQDQGYGQGRGRGVAGGKGVEGEEGAG